MSAQKEVRGNFIRGSITYFRFFPEIFLRIFLIYYISCCAYFKIFLIQCTRNVTEEYSNSMDRVDAFSC